MDDTHNAFHLPHKTDSTSVNYNGSHDVQQLPGTENYITHFLYLMQPSTNNLYMKKWRFQENSNFIVIP
jgi:hypothetical protein